MREDTQTLTCAIETDFSSEVTEIWGDLPKNTTLEVAEALCVAAADENLHGKYHGQNVTLFNPS